MTLSIKLSKDFNRFFLLLHNISVTFHNKIVFVNVSIINALANTNPDSTLHLRLFDVCIYIFNT